MSIQQPNDKQSNKLNGSKSRNPSVNEIVAAVGHLDSPAELEHILRAVGARMSMLAVQAGQLTEFFTASEAERITPKQIGERIRCCRKLRGLTLREVAERAQTHHQDLSDIENGGRMPSIATIDRLAHALGTSRHSILR